MGVALEKTRSEDDVSEENHRFRFGACAGAWCVGRLRQRQRRHLGQRRSTCSTASRRWSISCRSWPTPTPTRPACRWTCRPLRRAPTTPRCCPSWPRTTPRPCSARLGTPRSPATRSTLSRSRTARSTVCSTTTPRPTRRRSATTPTRSRMRWSTTASSTTRRSSTSTRRRATRSSSRPTTSPATTCSRRSSRT